MQQTAQPAAPCSTPARPRTATPARPRTATHSAQDLWHTGLTAGAMPPEWLIEHIDRSEGGLP